MNAEIPLVDLATQHATLRSELDVAISRVIASGQYILGSEVDSFERSFATYLGIDHAIGVSSGTAALQLALMACEIGRGHEVITASHTAGATVAAILQAGATPVLVDVDPARYTLDPAQLAPALTPRTRAIIPVHLYGCPVDMEPVLDFAGRHQLIVIEDCAQAHGALYRGKPVGTLGHIGAFSFYPTKNLGALGDGGAVVTADPTLAQDVLELRQYGWQSRHVSDRLGLNARLDEIQAAVLSIKLRHLDEWNARRRRLAMLYRAGLASSHLALPIDPPDCRHVYHQFVIRSTHRDDLRDALAAQGVASSVLYPRPAHLQPAYAAYRQTGLNLRHSEAMAAENLALPLYPELSVQQVSEVCRVIRDVVEPTGR